MLLLLGAGISALTASVTLADDTTNTTTPTAPTSVNDLFRPFNYTSGAPNGDQSKIGIVSNIAKSTSSDWQTTLTNIIKFLLQITGGIAFISFTYAGILMVSARGNEDQIKKGKGILVWSILALGIIALSYAIVLGISQLQFSTTA